MIFQVAIRDHYAGGTARIVPNTAKLREAGWVVVQDDGTFAIKLFNVKDYAQAGLKFADLLRRTAEARAANEFKAVTGWDVHTFAPCKCCGHAFSEPTICE